MNRKDLLVETARRINNEKYQFYTPIGKGELFINLFASGKYFILLFSAANGVGKTRLGVNILAHLMYPCGNKWFSGELFKKWKYIKRARIISDPTTVKQTIIRELKDQFPAGRYETNKSGKFYDYYWKTDNGWEFDIMTYDQQVKEFESATLGLVWFDEPPPKAIFKATVARMRKGGIIFITATPLTGSAWLYDSVISNPNNEKGYRTFIEAEIEDACRTHGVRGFLEHNNILKMIAQYDEEDMQARIFGKFQHLVGLVFKKFSRQFHIVEPFEINKKDYVVIEALDSHPRNPDAVTWTAINRQGTKYIVDEIYKNFDDIDELADIIKGKSSNMRIAKRIIDPSAFGDDQHRMKGELNLAEELSRRGLYYERGSKARTEAIKRTSNALSFQESAGVITLPPELYIFNKCYRTIWEFEHWQWDEWRGKSSENKNPKDKPQDKNDHMMENIGRTLLEDISFSEMDEYILRQSQDRQTNIRDDPFD